MSTAGDPDIKALLGEIKTLREDFARMGGVVEDLVRHRAGKAADEVGRRAERAWDGVNTAAEGASRAMEDNPLAAVGGAFGLGLLIGMLFSRR
jgi:ElaB/YqjD/DUF883 family membrane-anchored ribosome-binding protein